MPCPTLYQLPPVSNDKAGWPWTEARPALDETMPNGEPWPRVSVVTPSYNQDLFLEETIRSVLLQGYPNLEYIIIDGSSTDSSVEIIQKYGAWLSYWISEPDKGQSHAINKGFARSTGAIVAWLNSDDTLEPDAIKNAVLAMNEKPDAVLTYGDCNILDEVGQLITVWHAKQGSLDELILEDNFIPQQCAFFRRDALQQVGGVNQSRHFIMDYELWIRLGCLGAFHYSPDIRANFRWHHHSKSISQAPLLWKEHFDLLEELAVEQPRFAPAFLEEARRRFKIKTFLEYLFSNNVKSGLEYLESALLDAGWPYQSSLELAHRMVDHKGLTGCSLGQSPELMERCLEALSQIKNQQKAMELKRALLSYDAMRWAFLGYEQREWRKVRENIWQGLVQDPEWLRNRGVISILFQAYNPFRK